ncbi:uncharacterized protein LOC133519451 [Cydia pomonella]|uniref:uncharacterized protein LOC133519451 n=1 Tax=Cydia pomonella TaxID=82600 RepID=UPI002ADE2B03|nr:uncharacterized protein LOC133519451 [Cydia pomonella]
MLSNVLYTLFVSLVIAKDNEIIFQIKPETLINTFKSLKTSGYFQKLADEFALKTAEQFIKQLKNQQKSQKSFTSTREQLDELPKPLQSSTSNRLRKASIGQAKPQPVILDGKVSHDDDVQRRIKSTSKQKASDRVSSEERRSEQVMLTLMETPPPDGDNLENESVLTEVEEKKTENPLNFYKINGKHFRRYDFFWK